ncbi:TatD family hydrolase [Candidatus Mycoplasma haematominutum]|uniref:Hydrolase, TatD family n=1 Tax=Candidatus Mycoplasma haematominutum 'Birmingham 1' TaxID=1116213 RepID=G8C385_9MOLU|nr:TatD family hydrolase [Candidatus Mycoplasma haematominutum]CCE66783.1 hydrolase, TatD family [Candidatus Mycoplasma haematominutum 'Birmingham 1']
MTKLDYSYFETHIHFGADQFRDKVASLLQLEPRFQFLNVATSLPESYLVVRQSEKLRNVYCAVGVHPLYISKFEEDFDETSKALQKLILENEKIVAIGECGLDFYKVTREASLEHQVKWLKMQLELASKFELPVILHLRNAHTEALEVLGEYSHLKLIIHSFDGTAEELKKFQQILKRYYISLSPLVFRNFQKFQELIPLVPEDRILVESDAPFLASGSAICRSLVRIVSEVRGTPLDRMSAQIYKNSLEAFNLLSKV